MDRTIATYDTATNSFVKAVCIGNPEGSYIWTPNNMEFDGAGNLYVESNIRGTNFTITTWTNGTRFEPPAICENRYFATIIKLDGDLMPVI